MSVADAASIFQNLQVTIGLLVVFFTIYGVYIYIHKYSKKGKAAIEPFFTGILWQAITWLIITVTIIVLANQDSRFLTIAEKLFGSSTLSVILIALSFSCIQLATSVHQATHPNSSNKKIIAITLGIFVLIYFFIGLLYWFGIL